MEEWILGGQIGDNMLTPSVRGSLNTKRGWGGRGDVATFASWDQSFFVIPLLLDIHVYKGIYRPFCLPYSVP